ncbi:CHAT domain-containing protein [Pantanalinema rosaneae CENA516]|uniref:CHAT domain-containing protein n=1 Tax=Pantanalinema rosaneae TaxID=1620701 RepID=UPI003D6ED737
MARKRALLLDQLQSVLSTGLRYGNRWTRSLLLASLTVLFCLFTAPGFATFPSQPVPTTQSQLLHAQRSTADLVQQGKALYDQGQYEAAVDVLQQAVQQAAGDLLSQAAALSNLSLTYQQLGRWQEATQAIADSLNMLQTRPPGIEPTVLQTLLAQSLDIQGRLQLAQGQAEAALQTWQQTESVYANVKQADGIARSRINQSRALQAMGFYRRACDTLLQTLSPSGRSCETLDRPETLARWQRELNTQPASVTTIVGLRSLGDVLQLMGNVEASRTVLQISLNLAQQLSSDVNIQAAHLSLGNIARTQLTTGQLEQAMTRLAQTSDLDRATVNAALATIRTTIASIQTALTDYQTAATTANSMTTTTQAQVNQVSLLVESAQALLQALQILSPEQQALPILAPVTTELKRQASQFLTNALALLPNVQTQLTNLPANRSTIYAQINLARSLLKLGSQEPVNVTGQTLLPNLALPTSAQIAQLLTTAVQSAQTLKDIRAEAYALGYLAMVYEQNQQWAAAQRLTKRALWLAQTHNAADIAYRWQWQLGRLLAQQVQVTGGDRAVYTDAIAAYKTAIQTLQSLRGDLAAVNQDIQFTFRDSVEPVYREAVRLLLQPGDGSAPSSENLDTARKLIESLQLAELDNFFREACIEGQAVPIDEVVNQPSAQAAVIYPIVLPDQLQVIVKIPNQPLQLHTQPISQTTVEATASKLRQLLIKSPNAEAEIRQLSSQIYDWLIRPIAADLAQVDTLVFVPDGALRNIPMGVLYDGKQYLIETQAIALNAGLQLIDPKPLARTPLKALTAGLSDPPPGFETLGKLPAIADEINSITAAGVSTTTLLNAEFTRQALETQINAAPFNVIHLATHGQFSSRQSETFILAADGPINVSQFDRLLKSREFTRSEAVELLVMSACESAAGDDRATLGLAGAALRAGARSTMASLWQIDDRATATLVKQFYQELTNPELTKAEALRRAQVALLKQDGYSQPSYWSAYVLVGNWL